jgi:hypothetical protein
LIRDVASILAPDLSVEGQYEAVLLLREAAVPERRAEVVEPPQTAALAAASKP